MTDTNQTHDMDTDGQQEGNAPAAGQPATDANRPAQKREGPATGGEGAAGAGGPKGFGTGQ